MKPSDHGVGPTSRGPAEPAGARAPQSRTTTMHYPASGAAPILVDNRPATDRAGRLCATQAGEVVGEAELRPIGDVVLFDVLRPDIGDPRAVTPLAALLAAGFQACRDAARLLVRDPAGSAALGAFVSDALTVEGDRRGVVERRVFHQLPLLWRMQNAHVAYPAIRSELGSPERAPPLRPPQPKGVMYRRFLPDLGLELSLSPIDRREDLALFHDWMNQERVAFFWDMAKSAAELDAYLAEQEADPHTLGVIGRVGDEPAAYFEFYWAKEDRLGAHYEAEDFDRGWHGLIGNPRCLGRAKTLAWFRSLTHYLFLDDPRTMRIVGEPRASHVKMLSYCDDVAYAQVKEFDFPHKRAMLVVCERDRFFREVPL